ncbi:MAG: NADH-quinone oxidoreductase subunit H [Kiritimatiellae bacterium]|nr:NADH-quinone oxidoreductase subunit H [Kiritimatiellia bacterium]MDD5520087.1 NADH-quinone oxidoreductase subunit H [Kiritimatiellia bacterium]
MDISRYMAVPLGLIMAPFLLGVINRTKAFFAGRDGSPLLQAYFDIWKLLKKDAVYSRTTTWIFRMAPVIGLAAVIIAMTLVPVAGSSLFTFRGDLIFFAYCFGLMRFFTVVAALDTGSSFEGMGASREVHFSTLAEPALLLGLIALSKLAGSFSLSGMFGGLSGSDWMGAGPAIALVAIAIFIVFLAENSRIPVDDPNTHLELTMIHEVMILDYSGPDLGIVLYAASLKLWVLGALIVNIFVCAAGLTGAVGLAVFAGGMFLLAVIVGIVESMMARLSLLKVPQFLIGAGSMAVLALILVLRFVK